MQKQLTKNNPRQKHQANVYAGGAPVLFEDDIFKIEIFLEKSIEAESADKPPINFELEEQEQLIK